MNHRYLYALPLFSILLIFGFGCGQDRGTASENRTSDTAVAVSHENFIDLARYHYSRALSLPSTTENEKNISGYKQRSIPASKTADFTIGCSVTETKRFGKELTKLTLTCQKSAFSVTLHNHTYVTIIRYLNGKEVERQEQSLQRFTDLGADFPMGGES